MSKLTFNEYCEDFLDQHIGLMSDAELATAKAGYNALFVTVKKVAKHADAGMKLDALKSKVARLVASQKINVERAEVSDLSTAKAYIAKAEAALSAKTKKTDLLELITLNSEVSRFINSQK